MLIQGPISARLLLSLFPIKTQSWMQVAPMLGRNPGIMRLLCDERVTAEQLGWCLAGSALAALLAVLAVLASILRYRSEKSAISARRRRASPASKRGRSGDSCPVDQRRVAASVAQPLFTRWCCGS